MEETKLLDLIKDKRLNPNFLDEKLLKELLRKCVEEKDQEKLRILLQDPELTLKDTKLVMGKCFNKYNKFYPEGITHLTFGYFFNQEIKGAIQSGVTHLTFGWHFNKEIKGAIPNKVTHLTLGGLFNQGIKGAIPNSVTHLTLGCDFNQDIKGAIPESVTHLTFGWCFNQDIKGAIPENVTHLTFGENFNQEIKGAIPENVTHLTFGEWFNQDLKGTLPRNVIELKINKKTIDLNVHKYYYRDESSVVNETFYRYQNMIFYKHSICKIDKIDDMIKIKLIDGEIIEINQTSNFGKELMKEYFE